MWIINTVMSYFVNFLELMIFARIILSWFNNPNLYFISQFAYKVTEPILCPIRNITNKYINTGAIDISPIIALIVIRIVYNIVVKLLILLGI